MGTGQSSTAANLFLFYKCTNTVIYNKKINIFRYIDDILIFDYDLLNECKIYSPNCLQLNTANNKDDIADFRIFLFVLSIKKWI